VIEVWKDSEWNEMSAVTAAGLKAVLASPWYLNRISFGADWVSYYNVEPLSFNGRCMLDLVNCLILTVDLLTSSFFFCV